MIPFDGGNWYSHFSGHAILFLFVQQGVNHQPTVLMKSVPILSVRRRDDYPTSFRPAWRMVKVYREYGAGMRSRIWLVARNRLAVQKIVAHRYMGNRLYDVATTTMRGL